MDGVKPAHLPLPASTRRANLLLRGTGLRDSRGRILYIGQCRVRIFGEAKPCYQMDEALPGLKDLMWEGWAGGAFGEVVEEGCIAIGDPAQWTD